MEHDTKTSIVKAASAWGAVALAEVGINSWGDFGAFLASIYTLMLIGEWLWKRIFREIAERHGWVKPRKRGYIEHTGPGEL